MKAPIARLAPDWEFRQFLLLCAAMAVIAVLPSCSKKRSSAANPTAFCTKYKQGAAEFAGLQDNMTRDGARHYAATMREAAAVAPVELEGPMKTITVDWQHYLKTSDTKPLQGKAYAAAVDQANTWNGEFCK